MSAADWLRAWDSQGIHRCGSAADEAGAAWLEREAASLGVDVARETFELDRIDPVECFIEVEGKRIDGVPVFDSPPTDADGISGTLGTDIGIVELSPHAVYSGEFLEMRRSSTHCALVVVCKGAHPGLGLLNAEQFNTPHGAAAMHIAHEIPHGGSARLVSHYRRTRATARNNVVTLRGRDSSRSPLVVMTPRSSWWQSVAERGGGIVCWLECLGALLTEPPAMDVVLTANSGHELGHLGLDDFLARRPGWEREALWVHWGANLGAAGGELMVMSADDDLRALASRELADVSHQLASITRVPSGETRDIHRAGGRYLTFVGSNPLFHLPQDRWPHAVDLPAVQRIATTASRIVLALTR